jgi:hypothetical protein
MKKIASANFFTFFIVLLLVLQSCRNDSYLTLPAPVPDQSFVEEFDTLTAAQSRGWVIKNRSEPIGPGIWSQGPVGSAYSSKSTNDGCIISDATACHDSALYKGTLSNWVISPVIILQNNDHIVFYTKTMDGTWGDRLQVRLNIVDTSTNCGDGNDPGNFTDSLLDINPHNASSDAANLDAIPDSIYIYDPVNSYPTNWTRFIASVQGLSKPIKGRFAFRHYVPNGGDNGLGLDVLLDSVAYISVNHH